MTTKSVIVAATLMALEASHIKDRALSYLARLISISKDVETTTICGTDRLQRWMRSNRTRRQRVPSEINRSQQTEERRVEISARWQICYQNLKLKFKK